MKNEIHASSVKVEKDALIEMEKHYSIYYDDKWYMCYFIWSHSESLQKTHTGYKMPTCNDIQTVGKKFILYGPIQLKGNLSFYLSLNERDKVNTTYKKCKKKSTLIKYFFTSM